MKFVTNIKEKEFEKFASNHPTKSHFMQSYYWGNVSKKKGLKPYYVGMKDNGKLVATALMLKKPLFNKYCYFYIPRGFVTDFTNLDIVSEFTNELKKFGKKENAIFICMDPDIKLQDHDSDENVIDNNNNNYKLVNFLKSIDFHHKGFNKNFENREPRYTFRLDLTPDEDTIYKNMHPTTRKILNKGNQYNLNVYKGTEKDIDDFYITMKETSKREHLMCFSKEYYLNFYKELHNHGMSDLYVVKVKLKDLINTCKKSIKELKQEIKSLENTDYKNKTKFENKKKDLLKKLEKQNNELEKIKSIHQDEIVLSSIMTAKYNDKVWTVHGGNHTLLRELNSNYLLYYTIIKDAKDEGYKKIDFFGTTGDPKKNNSVYGIHLFKKRLGGEYTEFIGEFDLVINPFLYFMYTKIYPKFRKYIKKR